jgi:hypothetical protein
MLLSYGIHAHVKSLGQGDLVLRVLFPGEGSEDAAHHKTTRRNPGELHADAVGEVFGCFLLRVDGNPTCQHCDQGEAEERFHVGCPSRFPDDGSKAIRKHPHDFRTGIDDCQMKTRTMGQRFPYGA